MPQQKQKYVLHVILWYVCLVTDNFWNLSVFAILKICMINAAKRCSLLCEYISWLKALDNSTRSCRQQKQQGMEASSRTRKTGRIRNVYIMFITKTAFGYAIHGVKNYYWLQDSNTGFNTSFWNFLPYNMNNMIACILMPFILPTEPHYNSYFGFTIFSLIFIIKATILCNLPERISKQWNCKTELKSKCILKCT